MANIKLEDLYLSKKNQEISLNFLLKREILKTIKVIQAINYIMII